MGPGEVQRCWPWLSQLLRPAVEFEPGGQSLEDVRDLILRGHMGVATLHRPNAAAVIVMQPGMFDGTYCLWIPYLAGEVEAKPKAWLRLVREGMAHFVTKAREAGCAEIRIGGRDWGRVFPGWLPLAGVTNGLRKIL